MKKFLFISMAAIAFTMTSCNQKTENPENANDSIEVAVDEAQMATDELAAALEGNDASAFENAYNAAIDKVKNMDPALVKDYLAKVQEYVKTNIDKVKALVGGNAALAGAVDAFANMPAEQFDNATETITSLQDKLKGNADDAKEKAADAVNDAKDKVNNAVNDAVENTKEKANEAIDKAAEKTVNNLKDKIGL